MPFPDEVARALRVVDYDLRWPGEFSSLAHRLEAAVGSLVVCVEHIGSTAVPGLAAKDCIDVQIRVQELDPDIIGSAFAELGFRRRGEWWNQVETVGARRWPKLVFAPPVGERAVNVHVRPAGSASARRNLLFRDFLCVDGHARAAWGHFKQRLARTVTDLADYGQIKQPATEVLMIAAEDWANRTGWTEPSQ